ncbi:MAG: SGNH/GDSL hydrolase family protein [Spirochaetales bacterium]|nr:SGNH/GDSL hydrolase family protein [Spirochaetales bacterium]
MELKGTEIAQLLHNHICYRLTEDGYVHPLRYTEYQVRHLADFSEKQEIRALASANITIEFKTDSRRLGMNFRFLPGSSRENAGMDILSDGKLLRTFDLTGDGEQSFETDLEGGLRKITIFLPWSKQTEIGGITLDDGSKVERTGEKSKTVICMGDSITQGYMAERPTQTYVGRLATHLDAEVINQGNGGYILDSGLIDPEIKVKADLVTFAYGTNDYSREADPEAIRGNLDRFLSRLTETFPGVPVICITAPYRGSEKHFRRIAEIGWDYSKLREVFHQVCSKYADVTVIDDTVPHEAQFFAPDYTHPTDLGFEHYFNNIYPTVRELLNQNTIMS